MDEMTFDEAARRYTRVRQKIDELEAAHKTTLAPFKEAKELLESWFTAKAQEEGLSSVPTKLGLVYWSTHHNASVASREALFSHCKQHDSWDLIEARASKTGVKAYVEAHGEAPPGVNFSSVRVFNFRKSNQEQQ
jgi:hypothetical protein